MSERASESCRCSRAAGCAAEAEHTISSLQTGLQFLGHTVRTALSSRCSRTDPTVSDRAGLNSHLESSPVYATSASQYANPKLPPCLYESDASEAACTMPYWLNVPAAADAAAASGR